MKEKILEQARQLYNQNGLSNVTARLICERLKISLGSYSYHFPDKKNILINLYEQMLDEIQVVYEAIQKLEPGIITYLDSHKRLFLIQEKYKFFYLNLFEIMTNHAAIKSIHIQKRMEETAMAKQVFMYYMEMGVLKKGISEIEIERLVNVGHILNNFWPIDAEITPTVNLQAKLLHYMKICCGLLEPYLEQKSLNEYRNYFDSLEKENSKTI